MQVLSATAGEIQGTISFGVARQLLEPPLRGADGRERDALLAGAAAHAAPVLEVSAPETREAVTALPLYHGLYWLTANLAERSPLLLCVDDAHWADRSSLGFLLYLAQRLDDLRVAVVVGIREGEPDAPQDLLARLAGHRLARVFRLQPLSRPATDALIRARAPEAGARFCAACHDATGGNPFLALSLLQGLQAEGVALTEVAARSAADLAPESVVRSITSRVARLPQPAQALSRAAAVLGEDATLSHAAALAELDLGAAVDAADALDAAGLMVVCPTSLAFAHPLLQAGVYGDMPEARRALAHRRAAAVLQAAGAPAERVAAHLLAAPASADEESVSLLRAAARRAVADGEPAMAARYLRRALEEPPTGNQRLGVLVALGRAEALSGGPEAAEHLTAAAELAGDAVERARIRLELGRTLYANGRLEEAAEVFEQGRRDAAGADAELEADLRAGWATVARLDPGLRPLALAHMRELLTRGDDVATHGERVLLAHAAEQLVFAGEDREHAVALALHALSGNRLLEEETSDGMIWFLTVGDLGWCDEFDEQDRHIEAGFEDARRRGSVWGFANASYLRAFGGFYRGRVVESIADLEQAIDASRYGWEQFLPAVHMQLAWSLMERGELHAAERTLASVDGDPRWSQTIMQALVTGARGRLALMRGQPAAALADILEAG
ncbi:MAG: hypothetical protein ACR2L8_02085, partial [Solirubrobacteraceae bacterium]